MDGEETAGGGKREMNLQKVEQGTGGEKKDIDIWMLACGDFCHKTQTIYNGSNALISDAYFPVNLRGGKHVVARYGTTPEMRHFQFGLAYYVL